MLVRLSSLYLLYALFLSLTEVVCAIPNCKIAYALFLSQLYVLLCMRYPYPLVCVKGGTQDNLDSLSNAGDPIEQFNEITSTSTSTQTTDILDEYYFKIQHSKLTFSCQWECGRSFKTIRGKKRHEMFCKREENNLNCDICDKVFSRKFTRDSHRLTHFPGEKKDMQCPQCKIQCTTTRSLLNHKAIYTKKISYQCKYCNQIFCYQYHLDRHTKRHHSSKCQTKET